MYNEKVLTIERSKTNSAVWLVALIGIAMLAPIFHQQMLTGSVVNATLFVGTIVLGWRAGTFVGFVPSAIALSVGTLPPVLAPMVPYIMISNVILVLTFNFLKDRNFWLAVGSASFMKFLFLFSISSLVMNLLLKKELAGAAAAMMSWPQLITALAGGAIAWTFLRLKAGR